MPSFDSEVNIINFVGVFVVKDSQAYWAMPPAPLVINGLKLKLV